ncbi:F-box/kelch-repeat protein [Camellia lanceoleosa]|uniref:F-box/kelch-repeat protein n=1 Tax=Camellia lanceoleosa TaxID=1840588 RepID=A0ACC0H1N7_9ERIC|nr:F-box/kelch-repeat protein [Camellia lanceoleosa]
MQKLRVLTSEQTLSGIGADSFFVTIVITNSNVWHAEIFQAGIDVSLYEFAHGNHAGDLCKTTCPNTRVLQPMLHGNIGETKRYQFPDLTKYGKYFSRFRLVGSSNGLLCLLDLNIVLPDTFCDVVLWNPSIGKFKMLPTSQIESRPVDKALGFGFVPHINDYKVVRLVYRLESIQPEVEVYSLSTDSWRKMTTNFKDCRGPSWPSGTHLPFTCSDIWVMTDYGVVDSWTKQYSLRDAIEFSFGLMSNGEVLLIKSNSNLVYYDLKIHEHRKLKGQPFARVHGMFIYKESLALLNEGEAINIQSDQVAEVRA